MPEVVVFGAGNIGRSFVAPVLLDAGYRVTLVDISNELVEALVSNGAYTIEIRSAAGGRERRVSGFAAVPLSDRERVVARVAEADLVATSVGQRGLPGVCEVIARALKLRRGRGGPPLDIVLAENIRNGKQLCRSWISEHLPEGFPLDTAVGIVETSIGKMVPVVSDEQRAADPLRLYAEPYNTLILDRDAFRGAVPSGRDIKLVTPIEAYVDRKLFVHNLGHAAVAYHGRFLHPDLPYIWQVLEDSRVSALARGAMLEGAEVVRASFPGVFSAEELREHADELLERFRNRSLGDTVQRVGRDLRRKLSRDDRVVGAMRGAARHGLGFEHI
ncbi:MAG: mannitol-1-phosphate 5-dehydrogenase, partial [Spirochaetota bacterium]